ncbi:MAG TPA: hypothetical protein VJO72_09455, partial [Candidatus Dormibacteraeota bacterium]|nr:hypothetical protein [Candidatus Dormibacteraeota bacterium]
ERGAIEWANSVGKMTVLSKAGREFFATVTTEFTGADDARSNKDELARRDSSLRSVFGVWTKER